MTRFKIWSFGVLLAVILHLVFPLQPGIVQTRSSAISHDVTTFKCLLWSDPNRPCPNVTGYILPNRFLQMYGNMDEKMKKGIRAGRLETMTPEEFTRLPVPLFLLTPPHHLNSISGSTLASYLGKYSQDVAVAVKVLETVNIGVFEEFFKKLEGVELASQTQDMIAKAFVKWLPDVNSNWTYPIFRMIEKVGNPLLAHLPPYFLANLANPVASKFLFHLRNWLWSTLPVDMWSGKSEASKRAWTDMMLRSSYPFNLTEWKENEGRRFRYLLEGATPDELQLLTAQQLQNTKLFQTKLSRLQVQALFSILYSKGELSSTNLTDAQLLPVAVQLSPANLLRFNASSTDFRVLKSRFVQQEKSCSYITAKQIMESMIAQSVLSGRLESVKPETWGNGIEHFGKFVYVLPASALESYKLSPPSALVQSSIDSNKITAKQAHLLTGGNVLNLEKPDLIMGQKGLLRALSSSQLVSAGILPQNLLYHLLANLPSGMTMQVAALLQKVEKLAGDIQTLKKILSNKDPNQFFEMLPSRTVATIVTDIENLKGFEKVIKGLPQNTLSVLLTATRTKLTNQDDLWTSDILLSDGPNLALLGLTCNDIYAMEIVDFIYIISHYNRLSKSLNKIFPKDLQYCSQMALMNYLEMKASLQDFKNSRQLLDYLEPAEIEAIGGYILATLPANDVDKAINSQHMLEAIGQLPLPELLVATKEIKPCIYAQLLLKKLTHPCRNLTAINISELFSLGNLVHFLSATDIRKINPKHFKLFIESIGDSASKMVCADSATRSVWYQILLKAFGQPFSWTSGTLATLSDFLLVVPSHELNSVPENSWRDAADTLTEQTSYHMKVEWPGRFGQIQLYQACAEILEDSDSSDYKAAVHELARWYLAAVQHQLNTVVNASRLLTLVHQSKKGRTERKMVIPDIPMEIEHPGTIVKVLKADEVEQTIRVKKPGAEMDFTTDQYDRTTTRETTPEKPIYFEDVLDTTLQSHTTISESNSSKQSEMNYNVKTTTPSSEISSVETAARNSTESITVVMPDELTTLSTALQTSTVGMRESDRTIDVPLRKVFEELELNISTEVAAKKHLQILTPTEKSSINTHELNNIENDNYLSDIKGLIINKNVVESTTVSHNDSAYLENATFNYPTLPALPSNDSSMPSNALHSADRNPDLMTVAENVAKNVTPEIHEITLENSSVSLEGKRDNISLKMDEEISLSAKEHKHENVQVKRHATVEDEKEQKGKWASGDHNQAEQSGEILRSVIRKTNFTSHNIPPGGSSFSPKNEAASEQSTERGNITRYWQKVTCEAIRATGNSAGLALDETDIELMGIEELEMCVDTLGLLELDIKVQRKIWSLVNKDILLENLSDLGHILQVLDVDDVSKINVNLSSYNALDNLAILSKMVTDTHVLHELGSHFLKNNPDIKKLTTETAVALGRILCEVITISSQKLPNLIEQSVFLQASPVLGRMKDCPIHCLHKFAHQATRTSEYGPLETWTAEDIATLGVIPTGLKAEQWRQLSSTGYGNNPLVGLRPSAIKCISPQIFKELDDDQLKSLPTLSAAVVSEEQLSHLSESQHLALARIQKEVPVLKYSESTDLTINKNDNQKDSASSKDWSLLVIVTLTVISRFIA